MKTPIHNRIEVEWEDSTAISGWSTLEDAARYANSTTIIISVGMELVNDGEYIVMALSVAPNKVGELLKIPKVLVRKVTILVPANIEFDEEVVGNA